MENALNTTPGDSVATLPLRVGVRVQVWTGLVGVLVGFARGWCRVAIDGELTISGRPRIDEWQAWQVRAVVLLPA